MKDKLYSLKVRPTIVKISIFFQTEIYIQCIPFRYTKVSCRSEKKLSYTLCENTKTKKCQDAFDDAQVTNFGCT